MRRGVGSKGSHLKLEERDYERCIPAYTALSRLERERAAAGNAGDQEGGGGAAMLDEEENEDGAGGLGWENLFASDENEDAAGGGSSGGSSGGSAYLGVMLVVHQCFHGLYDEEVAIRAAAVASLRALVRLLARGPISAEASATAAAATPGKPKPHQKQKGAAASAAAVAAEERVSALRAGRLHVLFGVLLPQFKSAVRCRSEVARRGALSVIAELVRHFHAASPAAAFLRGLGPANPAEDRRWTGAVSQGLVPFADLFPLLNDEDPEVDFFLNVAHVQLHRRARAMKRLARLLGDGGGDQAWDVSVTSVAHVLLPLAVHPLHEVTRGAQLDVVLPDTLLAVTALCRRLPWGRYASTLRQFLQQLSATTKQDEKAASAAAQAKQDAIAMMLPSQHGRQAAEKEPRERALAAGLCAAIDGFHFALSAGDVAVASKGKEALDFTVPAGMRVSGVGGADVGGGTGDKGGDAAKLEEEAVFKEGEAEADGVGEEEEEDKKEEEEEEEEAAGAEEEEEGNKVWAALEGRLLPMLHRLVVRPKVGSKGEKLTMLRSNVTIALMKLVLKLPPTAAKRQLPQLIGTVCNSLRSKNQDTRDGARAALAAMARDLGPAHLPLIVGALKSRLVMGYMLHVRAASLHAVVLSLSKAYAPPPATDGRFPVLPVAEIERLAAARAALKHPSVLERARAAASEWSRDAFDAAAGAAGAAVGDGKGAGLAQCLQTPGVAMGEVLPPLDGCAARVMELCMDDLFGEAAESREATGVVRSEVKEAKGSRTMDTLETLARVVLFRPSYVLLALPGTVDPGGASEASSVHALVAPLVRRLNRHPGSAGRSAARDVAKATEALERVAAGLGANPSVDPRELLLYVYSTANPFVRSRFGAHRKRVALEGDGGGGGGGGGGTSSGSDSDSDESDDGDDGDEEEEERLEWTAPRTHQVTAAAEEAPVPGQKLTKSAKKRLSEQRRAKKTLATTTWLPSMAAGARLREGGGGVKSIVGNPAAGLASPGPGGVAAPPHKKARSFAAVQVLDGAQAPKLTGRDRLRTHHRPGEGVRGKEGGGFMQRGFDDGMGGTEAGADHAAADDDDAPAAALNEAAAHGTVLFALTVLHHHLKRGVLSPSAMQVAA